MCLEKGPGDGRHWSKNTNADYIIFILNLNDGE